MINFAAYGMVLVLAHVFWVVDTILITTTIM